MGKVDRSGDTNAQACGWLKDKYGLSWQVVPKVVSEMMGDPDVERVDRVMNKVLSMKKIDIETLKQAYEGENCK